MMDETEQVHRLVNEIRRGHGLVTLRRAPLLDRAAMGHAVDMARYRYHGHTDREGRSVRTRITRTGYFDGSAGYVCAENVAMGYETARAVVDAWMDSLGHRANILTGEFVDGGVGVAIDSAGLRYWAHVFGARYEP
jgi:uncharacterized protein YkwD